MDCSSFDFFGETVVLRSVLVRESDQKTQRWYVANDIGKLLTHKPNDTFSRICPSKQRSVAQLFEFDVPRSTGLHPFHKLVNADGIMEVLTQLRRTTNRTIGVRELLVQRVFPHFRERCYSRKDVILHVSTAFYHQLCVPLLRLIEADVSWFALDPFVRLLAYHYEMYKIETDLSSSTSSESTTATIVRNLVLGRADVAHVRRFSEFGATIYDGEYGVQCPLNPKRAASLSLKPETLFVDAIGLYGIVAGSNRDTSTLTVWLRREVYPAIRGDREFCPRRNAEQRQQQTPLPPPTQNRKRSVVAETDSLSSPVKRVTSESTTTSTMTTSPSTSPSTSVAKPIDDVRLKSLEERVETYCRPVETLLRRYESLVVRSQEFSEQCRLQYEQKLSEQKARCETENERLRLDSVRTKVALQKMIDELENERVLRRQNERERNVLYYECQRLRTILEEATENEHGRRRMELRRPSAEIIVPDREDSSAFRALMANTELSVETSSTSQM